MEKEYYISNLDCAHCGAKIEEAIRKINGIESAVLNFPLRKIKISGTVNDELLEIINKTANSIEAGVIISAAPPSEHHHEHSHHHHHDGDKCHCSCDGSHAHDEKHSFPAAELFSLLIGILLFAAAIIIGKITDLKALSLCLYIVSYILIGYKIIITTIKNILSGNIFDENFLMTVATIGASILGEFSEAVGVVLFYRIGELFEDFAVSKSRKAITAAADLKVDKAEVLRNGEFISVDSDEIQIGDILRIKAGERIAADGIIETGESKIDTSAVNGEPVPLIVKQGNSVFSGCINLSGTLTLRTTASASESMISKIADAVETASAEKPRIDRFITRFAKIYTPIVLAIALLTAIVPSLVTGETTKWVYSALTFLVISCPCALVLSVPLTYFSGIGAASKLGILFKGGSAIEALAKVNVIAFDKTGTLTDGSFNLTDIKVYGDTTENELLSLCGSCEQCSAHPVAESIVEYCRTHDIPTDSPDNSTETSGQGVRTTVNGKDILCGSEKFMTANNISIQNEDVPFGSVVYTAVNGKTVGRIIVSDSLKKTSASAVSDLKRMNVKTAMLTGDKTENAEAVAKLVGIETAKGDLLPDSKLKEIEKLRKENGAVMFVGDGFNDGPVLAGADVGGAMQNGSDLALEAADAVFMNSEPESVVKAKRITNTVQRIAYENIIFALTVKATVLILGLTGHPNIWFAVFADSGTAMLCVLNSLRVLLTKKYR